MKYCLVPNCINNPKSNPEKHFFNLKKDDPRREAWLRAVHKPNLSPNTTIAVCQDHFNLEEDLENYMRFKYYPGATKLKLKEGVVPHIFPSAHPAPQESREEPLIEHLFAVPTTPPKRKFSDVGCSPLKPEFVNTASSPFKVSSYGRKLKRRKLGFSAPSTDEDISSGVSVAIQTSSCSPPLSSSSDSLDSSVIREAFIKLITKKSKSYLGIPNDCKFVIQLLHEKTKLPLLDIYVVLLKIKKNFTFKEMADFLCLSRTNVTRLFAGSIGKIAAELEQCIVWPPQMSVKRTLPIPFRLNYSKVNSIIDCFEIQIEKPTDPIKQTLTWSEYKKCNTMKFLLSIMPNGVVNYVPNGFGGRTSDINVVKSCKYLEKLPAGSQVMADRGFKNIERTLVSHGCQLVRPPSVSSNLKLSRSEAIEAKKIASLRVHVERLIRKHREFKFLGPHSTVNKNLIKYLDCAVLIAAGLINLQDSYIKS